MYIDVSFFILQILFPCRRRENFAFRKENLIFGNKVNETRAPFFARTALFPLHQFPRITKKISFFKNKPSEINENKKGHTHTLCFLSTNFVMIFFFIATCIFNG